MNCLVRPLTIFYLCAVTHGLLPSQTPPQLRNLTAEEIPVPRIRNWQNLGISNYELRKLERFYRDETGVEGYHIAYESLELNIAGILVQPHIEIVEEDDAESLNLNADEEEPITYPLIILSHGSTYGLTEAYRQIAISLASRGYIVLAPSYRGRGGREGRSQGSPQLARGEVLDLLQLVQIGRQIEYVDTQRMALIGFRDGATTALLGIKRSNVFKLAVLVSPEVFSGMAEYGYTGLTTLKRRSNEIFGRQLSRVELFRELRHRETFHGLSEFRTPMLLITTGGDPSRQELLYFINNLQKQGIEPRLIEYPSMFPGFLTAVNPEQQREQWNIARDEAWGVIMNSIDAILAIPDDDIPDCGSSSR